MNRLEADAFKPNPTRYFLAVALGAALSCLGSDAQAQSMDNMPPLVTRGMGHEWHLQPSNSPYSPSITREQGELCARRRLMEQIIPQLHHRIMNLPQVRALHRDTSRRFDHHSFAANLHLLLAELEVAFWDGRRIFNARPPHRSRLLIQVSSILFPHFRAIHGEPGLSMEYVISAVHLRLGI